MSCPVAIRTTSEPDQKLNAGARHDTVSGSRRRTSYRGEILYIFQYNVREIYDMIRMLRSWLRFSQASSQHRLQRLTSSGSTRASANRSPQKSQDVRAKMGSIFRSSHSPGQTTTTSRHLSVCKRLRSRYKRTLSGSPIRTRAWICSGL
jgi:hypothetical protein